VVGGMKRKLRLLSPVVCRKKRIARLFHENEIILKGKKK